jgi:hypothetical protein
MPVPAKALGPVGLCLDSAVQGDLGNANDLNSPMVEFALASRHGERVLQDGSAPVGLAHQPDSARSGGYEPSLQPRALQGRSPIGIGSVLDFYCQIVTGILSFAIIVNAVDGPADALVISGF